MIKSGLASKISTLRPVLERARGRISDIAHRARETAVPVPPQSHLREALVVISGLLGRPALAEHVFAGLPVENETISLGTFQRACERAGLKTALVALMAQEQPYRDPDLTLADLAEALNTTPHKLSEVLNSEVGQTFYDFVNSYRVEEVRRQLAEAKSRRQNVLALAMDAGFASKSTFNQVFKKRTGQTPSSYRNALAGGN